MSGAKTHQRIKNDMNGEITSEKKIKYPPINGGSHAKKAGKSQKHLMRQQNRTIVKSFFWPTLSLPKCSIVTRRVRNQNGQAEALCAGQRVHVPHDLPQGRNRPVVGEKQKHQHRTKTHARILVGPRHRTEKSAFQYIF